MTARIRVLLVDDHGVFRLGLRALLERVEEITVVGEASSGREALVQVTALKPDVVVMDVSMAEMDGAEATRRLVASDPAIRVLALTMHDEREYLIPLLEAGARGYVVKSAAETDLVAAIRAVAGGEVYVRPAAAGVLAERWQRRETEDQARKRFDDLSERERAVLVLVARGFTAAQIGEQLAISPKTVDTYKRRINEKAGLEERAGYVRLALELGLLGGPK